MPQREAKLDFATVCARETDELRWALEKDFVEVSSKAGKNIRIAMVRLPCVPRINPQGFVIAGLGLASTSSNPDGSEMNWKCGDCDNTLQMP